MSTATSSTASALTRSVLEIVTAVLLGLVSVATAVGAYQAGLWSQESTDLALISQQARDRNLALYLERDQAFDDDGSRLFDALALTVEAEFYPERAGDVRAEQDLIISAGSPALQAAWGPWVDSGFTGTNPFLSTGYIAFSQAEPQAYNIVSTVADRSADAVLQRANTMTVVSVVFAAALLMLGVASATSRLDVAAIMTGGGAAGFLAGVAIVIFGVF